MHAQSLFMRFQYLKPTGLLSQYVRHYWLLESEVADGEVCERVIPTGNIELMFHYKKPFQVKNAVNPFHQPRSLITGISDSYSDVSTCGESGVIAVTFFPHGASNFFRFPLSEIENTHVALSDIFNQEIKEVEEQICTADSFGKRVDIIGHFLMSRFNPIDNRDLSMIQQGVKLINRSRGQISASALSDELFLTGKSLERKFSALLGKTPKQFIRIVRFQGVIQDLSNLGGRHLTGLAYDNGYFDQSHFVKDFKILSGYTPKDFLALGPCQSDYYI